MTVQVSRVVVQVADVEIDGQNATEVRAFAAGHLEAGRAAMFPLEWRTERELSAPHVQQIRKSA